MTNNNANLPAFPLSAEAEQRIFEGYGFVYMGLTKREYLAGLAMQGMVGSIDSEENYLRLKSHATRDGLTVSQWISRDAIKQADALINELAKGE